MILNFSFFMPGDRVYDTHYKQIGIVYMVSEEAIQVAFPNNITRHGGRLNYTRAYESKFLIENSRLQIVNDNGQIMDLEESDTKKNNGKTT